MLHIRKSADLALFLLFKTGTDLYGIKYLQAEYTASRGRSVDRE